jgi:S1-C subfamily serine protease
LARYFYKKYGGAVIKSIDQDSPLKGVEVGDRIVEIDGRKVRNNFDFGVDKGKKRRFKVVKANVQM